MKICDIFKYCTSVPLVGRWLFSFLLSFFSPYTCSIPIRFTSIVPGKVEATVREKRAIQNPFKSIHAAALINLGEAVAAVSVLTLLEEYAPKVQAIPTSVEGVFLKKARGLVTATCNAQPALLKNSKINLENDQIKLVTELTDENQVVVCNVNSVWSIKDRSK